jgi:hypothetical protein
MPFDPSAKSDNSCRKSQPHRSAAAHWDIGPAFWKIELTTPHSRRSRKGLAAELNEDRLTHLIEEADRKGRVRP